jgi:hypothetical protein
MSEQRVTVTISVDEILSLKSMLMLGNLWTKSAHRNNAQAFMNRVGTKLKKVGIDSQTVDRLVKLEI